MLNETRRFRGSGALFQLLAHYAEAGLGNREAWQDRVMELEGLQARDLSRLHGELIAGGWIEQNTGFSSVVKAGAVPQCYRVTAAGLRAFKEEQGGEGRRGGKPVPRRRREKLESPPGQAASLE